MPTTPSGRRRPDKAAFLQTAWRKATCRCRHARGFLPDHRARLEKRRDRPHADPGRVFAAPAVPVHSCRAAYRCAQPPARRARWRERQSTAFQRIQHQAQGCALHTGTRSAGDDRSESSISMMSVADSGGGVSARSGVTMTGTSWAPGNPVDSSVKRFRQPKT